MFTETPFARGRFFLGDCFDVMASLPDASVDMVLCDLPYGTTQNKWDSVLPLDRLWAEYWRVCKPNAAIVLTAAQPFTTTLIASQMEHFKYAWAWRKSRPTGQLNAKKQPLRDLEDIPVFYRNPAHYAPIMATGRPNHVSGKPRKKGTSTNYGQQYEIVEERTDQKYPKTCLEFDSLNPRSTFHPTQKPVPLFEYLICTYTLPGQVVLDNTAGSATTAIAAENADRRWICIERDEDYAAKALARIRGHVGAVLDEVDEFDALLG